MARDNTKIENTSLWRDISPILNSATKPYVWDYRAMLHTEKHDIPIMKLLSIDVIRDYVNHVGDLVEVSFMMPMGDYMVKLFPYRSNLEFTIKKIAKDTRGSKIVRAERYKAVFEVDKNTPGTGKDLDLLTTDLLNMTDIATVRLQLLDRSLEPLRIKTVQNVFKDTTQYDLMHSVLSGESMKVYLDGKPCIDGVDIVEPDNRDRRKQVVIPSGTTVVNLPTYLQESAGGVYSTGIGTYLQRYNDKKYWYVYPLSNTKRFLKHKGDRLIAYAVPEDKFPGVTNTYTKDGTTVKMVCTGRRSYKDDADLDYMNQGVGFRMMDANVFNTKPIEVTEDGPKANRARTNHEVMAEARKDGLNYAPRMAPSSNPYKHLSAIAARDVSVVTLSWENADIDLIYPGMPCIYTLLEDGKPLALQGTVAHVHAVIALAGPKATSSNYLTTATITMLCETKKQARKDVSSPSQWKF
jgi:hypothetical protein